jgi:hypothetical protein
VVGYFLSIRVTMEQVILNPAADIPYVQPLSKTCIYVVNLLINVGSLLSSVRGSTSLSSLRIDNFRYEVTQLYFNIRK